MENMTTMESYKLSFYRYCFIMQIRFDCFCDEFRSEIRLL